MFIFLYSSQFNNEKQVTRELVYRSIENCGLIITMNNKKMQTIGMFCVLIRDKLMHKCIKIM